jgi:hypothetical protein
MDNLPLSLLMQSPESPVDSLQANTDRTASETLQAITHTKLSFQSQYAIPQGLSLRLLATASNQSPNIFPLTAYICHTESLELGLRLLVNNALQALDALYFAQSRQSRQLSHYWVLRVQAGSGKLTITDCGIGMTRADLINSIISGGTGLGIKNIVQKKKHFATLDESNPQEQDTESNAASDNDDSNDDDEEALPDEQDAIEETELGCMYSDLGGFFAAICALGVGVCVCTKSKFDDYYEAEIGLIGDAKAGQVESDKGVNASFDCFKIKRPHPEGTLLTVENGHDKFCHVRGESGTAVTIQLNEKAIQAGYADEEVLRPIFAKVVETTQYTVAFSSDPEAPSLIAAAAMEKDLLEESAKQDQDQPILEPDGALNPTTSDTDKSTHHCCQQSHSRKIQQQHNTVKESSRMFIF